MYIGSSDGNVYTYSAAGSTSCSGTPKVCSPLWTAAAGSILSQSPAVANGSVYVSSTTGLFAFKP